MKRFLSGFSFLVLLAPAGASADPAPTVSRLGSELRVNSITRGAQTSPAVASGPQGDFVAVWLGPDGFGSLQVFGQRFDAAGTRRGGEILIGSVGFLEGHPRVAAGPDGGFVAVWLAQGVWARFYGPDGTPRGEPVRVSASTQVMDADVAVNGAGEAMIVWPTGMNPPQILARRYDPQGQPQGEAAAVSAPGVELSNFYARVEAAPDGDFLAVWLQAAESGDALQARRFDAGTGWGPGIRLTPNDGALHLVAEPAFRPDGSFFLTWEQITFTPIPVPVTPHPRGRSFLADGTPEGDSVELSDLLENLDPPTVAVDRSGNALVVADNLGSAIHGGIYAILYDRSWHPLTAPLQIDSNGTTFDRAPSLAASAGGFLAVWQRRAADPYVPPPAGTDGDSWGIFGQRLGDPRCAAGSEVLCLGPNGAFEVRVDWKNPATGETGTGRARPLTGDTGAFWFFDAANLELMVKVLDGRAVNGHFWLFYGALSNVEYTVTATNTATGEVKTYHNPAGQFASRADVDAFAATPVAVPAVAVPASSPAAAAAADGLLLAGGRFRVEVGFTDPRTGTAGQGHPVPLTDDTGTFWFFDGSNLELMVKVLDGRTVNGNFWVFYGALSDVDYTVTVTDLAFGTTRAYHNDRHHLASGADIASFPVAVSAQ